MSRPDANAAFAENNNTAGMQQYPLASLQYYSANIARYANSGLMDAWSYSNYGYGTTTTAPANQYSGPTQPQPGKTENQEGSKGVVPLTSQQQYYNMTNPVQYQPLMNYSVPPPPPPPPQLTNSSLNNSLSCGPSVPNQIPSFGPSVPNQTPSCGPSVPNQIPSFGPSVPNQTPSCLPDLKKPPPGCHPPSQSQTQVRTLPPPPPPPPEVPAVEIEPITISCPPMPPTFPWMSPAMFAPLAACDFSVPPPAMATPKPHSISGNDQSLKKIFPKFGDKPPAKPPHLQWTDPIDPTLPQVLKNMFQPLFCKLCDLSLSSAIVASDHYKGKRHKKCIETWLVDHPEQTSKRSKDQVDESRVLQTATATKLNAGFVNASCNEPHRNGPNKKEPLLQLPRNTFLQETRSNDFRSDKRGNLGDTQSNKNASFDTNRWNRISECDRNNDWNRSEDGVSGNFGNCNKKSFSQSKFIGETSEWNSSRAENNRWNSNKSQTSFGSASPPSDSGSSSWFGEGKRNNPGWQKRDGDFGGWSNQGEGGPSVQDNSSQPPPLMSLVTGSQRDNTSRFPPVNSGARGNNNVQGGTESRKPYQMSRPFRGKGRPFHGNESSFQDKRALFQQNKRSGPNLNEPPPAKRDKTDFKGSFCPRCDICNIVLNSKPSADQHFAGKKHRENLLNMQKTGQYDHVDKSFGIGTAFREKEMNMTDNSRDSFLNTDADQLRS